LPSAADAKVDEMRVDAAMAMNSTALRIAKGRAGEINIRPHGVSRTGNLDEAQGR